jgi:hypothetical protein
MFYLDLKKDNSIVTVPFKELDHSLGKKWAKALKNHIDLGYPVAQPYRIYNLNNNWTESKIIDSINFCIDKINEYEPFIDFRLLNSTMSQEDSNILHRYFELMRGENDQPNEFYLTAPRDIKEFIEEYNVLIHRWEDLGSPGRIVVHFKERPMFDLDYEDYKFWTLGYDPGDVRLNYCHKGKPLWDVFKDGDLHVGDDNIRPQTRYSPDFNISFAKGPGITKRYLDWWKAMGPKLNQLGFYKDDPKCAVGQAVIGKIVGNIQEIKDLINGSTEIIKVRYDNT